MAPATSKKMAPELQALVAMLNAGSKTGGVQYLKDGDTTVKLLLPPGRKTHPNMDKGEKPFFEAFQNTFKGEEFTYFIIAGVITEADEDGVADPARVKHIKVTKGVVLDIINNLPRWKQLFEEDGPVFVITKGKKGGKVQYTCAPQMETFDATGLPWPEASIEEAAESEAAKSRESSEAGLAEGELLK